MKLYIPTSTLNFNNIATTESLSPSSYYGTRGFGNRRFYSVEANAIDTAILLYSKFPRFHVEDGDLENFPMVIEIDTEDYSADLFHKYTSYGDIDMYVCYASIYFNVFHTLFYFRNYSELQSVVTKSEQSLEAKYAKIYRSNLRVKQSASKSFLGAIGGLFSQQVSDEFDWNKKMIPTDLPNVESHVEKDVFIDRIKGFIFCYVIGANTSVSPEIGKLKSLSRRITNTLSAIVNSPDHRPSDAQDQSMTNDINTFKSIYEKIDDDLIFNQKLISSRLENDPCGLSPNDIMALLERLGVKRSFLSTLRLKPTYDIYSVWDCVSNYSTDGFNRAVSDMQNAIRKCEAKGSTNRSKVYVTDLIKLNGETISISDNTYNIGFYERLIQSQIKDEYVSLGKQMDINDEPLALAFNGGKLLKSLIPDWNNNIVAKYMNAFLTHLQESTAFDIFSYENEVLNSFIAFCQKGDNIDRLSEYLIQCGFSNYKLAFGIYGATRGFASLPKTFTSILIDGNKEYFKQFACDLYKMLFNVALKDVEYVKSSNEAITSTNIGRTIVENINDIEKRESRQNQVMSAVNSAIELEDAVQSPKAFMFILDSIPNFTRTKAYKNLQAAKFQDDLTKYSPEEFKEKIYKIIGKKDLKAQKEKIDFAIELEAERQNPQAFLYILDNFLDKNSSQYKKIASLVTRKQSKVNQITIPSEPELTSSIDDYKSGKVTLILNDNYWVNKCASFIDDKKARDQFICDIDWFKENHKEFYYDRKKGAIRGYYYGHPTSNERTLERLATYLRNKQYSKNEHTQWLTEIYAKIPVEKIINYLKSVYGK
jgi:hypothetical protein